MSSELGLLKTNLRVLFPVPAIHNMRLSYHLNLAGQC